MQLVSSHRNIGLQTAFSTLQSLFLRLRAESKKNKARRERYRNTFNELHSLSNYDLADLGISRSEIHQVALDEMAKEPKS